MCQPQDLAADALASLDAVIALGSPHPPLHFVELTAAVADAPRAQVAELLEGPTGRAVLARREHPGRLLEFTFAPRITPHLRHEHKYEQLGFETDRQFYFQTDGDNPTGKTAANLSELEHELGICDSDVLRHHCPSHDFSRWIADVFHDRQLAASLAAAETQISAHSPSAVVEKARLALVAVLQARHAS